MFEKIIEKLYAAKNVMIFSHVNMDGDAMGSTMALCRVMRKLGKDCHILIEDAIPHYLKFMVEDDFFVDMKDYRASGAPAPDLAIAVDIGQESRLENRVPEYKSAKDSVCIDHHRHTSADCGFANAEVRDPSAAAACVLVQEMIEEMEKGGASIMDREIAENVYTGIFTDTGSFRYSNADARTHLCVARLFAYGIDQSKISTCIYDSYPQPQLKMEALAMSRVQIFAGGKGCYSWVRQEDFANLGADMSMSETCIDRLRSIEGVEVAAFFKQIADGTYKVSMRSKRYADVGTICTHYNGGGHKMAAGCSFSCSLEEAIPQLKAGIEEELAKWTE